MDGRREKQLIFNNLVESVVVLVRSAWASAKIKSETGLTASAGVSYNKFLAKLASGQNKPDGLFVITPKLGPAFVEGLLVRKFHGVGPATADKMARLGIETGADLRAQSLAFLEEKFGKAGPYYYWIARGIDERPVRADRERKSVGAEDTFAADIFDLESARKELARLVGKVWRYCEERSIQGRTVTLKVKFADFQQITRSRTVLGSIGGGADLATVSSALLDQVFPVSKGIRLLGVTLSNLSGARAEADRQMSLTI